eukprot:1670490-Prorocentrum_lima.AAC.1
MASPVTSGRPVPRALAKQFELALTAAVRAGAEDRSSERLDGHAVPCSPSPAPFGAGSASE